MRLGLIARACNRGLGIQTHSAYRALSPAQTLVIDCPSANPLPLHFDRFPDAKIVHGWPTERDFRPFLEDVDVVYTAECDYTRDGSLYSLAERMRVKTVLHLNWEFFDHARNPNLPRPSLFAAPSMWHYDEIPTPKLFLPVPIETDRFRGMQRPAKPTATHFAHIVGRPAVHDRNGTTDLLAALPYVRSRVTVTIRCQDPAYVPSLLHARTVPSNVELVVVSADIPNYWDAYRGADVLVMPRRFGGLCLPCNEALGAGAPVIMPNISPNEWLPADWLVPATKTGSFMAKTRIDVHTTDPRALAAKIDQFATDSAFYTTGETIARDLGERNSWEALLPEYQRVFASLCRT